MEQVIFIAIILFLSVLDSIARTRRAKQRQAEHDESLGREEDPDRFEWAQGEPFEDLPTYDDDPTYDDEPSYDDLVRAEEEAAAPPSQAPTTTRDLLEELASVLSGQSPTVPEPDPETPVSERARPDSGHRIDPETPSAPSSRGPSRAPGSPGYTHEVHRAHAGYGTDPSERAPSEQDGLDPLAARPTETATAIQEQLRRGGRQALREAVILKEVLGPPVAMRDD